MKIIEVELSESVLSTLISLSEDWENENSKIHEEKTMCEICEKVKTIDFFPTPKAYLECLNYIQSLVDSGNFLFESKDCDTDKVKDANGYWIDDIISHVIKCKRCGQCFSCAVVTYRGSGSFRKGK